MSLDSLIGGMAAKVQKQVAIDVSAEFGQAPNSVVFQLQEPSVAQFYEAGEYAQNLRKRHPDFPQSMATQVCLLAISHRSPAAETIPIEQLYAQIAEKNPDLYMRILQAFAVTCPWLQGLAEAATDRKNDSRQEEEKPPPASGSV